MEVAQTAIAHDRTSYTKRCPYCGFEMRTKSIHGSSVPVVKDGNYGSNATPQPVTFADEMYEATTISFVAASGTTPAYLSDSACLFGEKHFSDGMTIRVATSSGTNDGDYTIAARGVTRWEILLSSSDSLTDEDASTAGIVTISMVIYKPDESAGGCPFCHSRNVKGG
jgi:hypothetical protein